MQLLIREERTSDRCAVNEVIRVSFKNEDQVMLCEMLKKRMEFVKELSFVAEINGIITGYILLSPLYIQTTNSFIKTLWLEPVCVHPQFQRKGIGTSLITTALAKAKIYGFESVFVIGSNEFYSRFGFTPAIKFGIRPSAQIPFDSFLAMELKENSLKEQGIVIYPEEIFE